jgi:hypothetical protein
MDVLIATLSTGSTQRRANATNRGNSVAACLIPFLNIPNRAWHGGWHIGLLGQQFSIKERSVIFFVSLYGGSDNGDPIQSYMRCFGTSDMLNTTRLSWSIGLAVVRSMALWRGIDFPIRLIDSMGSFAQHDKR